MPKDVKCTQEGDYIRSVVYLETCNTLRTDNSFRNRTQPEHHTGNSILEKLPIGMVSQIPLDYMHLVCLGVTKRLIQLWQRGKKNFRLSKEYVNAISLYLTEIIKPYIPSEFARKPRYMEDIDRWKATELRQFLFYTGIVIMKSILSPLYYNHFLCLSVAIRILIDPQLCVTFNDYAKLLLLHFVSNYGNMYGYEYISYNVHNLIHLADDVLIFGSLDNFSCFKFENYMQKIKQKLHQSGKPLKELANRIFEESQLPIQPCNVKKYPIVNYTKNNKTSYLQFETFKIANNKSDNCALLHDMSVIFILEILEEHGNIYLRAQSFLNLESVFTSPCPSKKLGIFMISDINSFNVIKIPATHIQRKCVKIKCFDKNNKYVTIPILHFNN
ncbi:uncharacterized protein [Cardiocondyla obscurior]|uniref:uncharacterized protein n=1 Tax=Cardiocondyla obscurior TaxID=286306 RepID=UPI0039655FB6